MSRRPTLVVFLAFGSIAAVGCGATTGPTGVPPMSSIPSPNPSVGPESPAPSPSAAPDLILKVTSEGGFINPVAILNALPLVEVYADGRILTPAPAPATDPGPLVPMLGQRTVGADGARAIAAAIHAAGLDRPATVEPGVPGDSGVDVFRVTTSEGITETRVSGNGPGVGRPGGIGGSADPGRAAALDLLSRLVDPAEAWGAAPVAETTYQPTGYRLFAAPVAPTEDPSAVQPPVAWPLATPLDAFGTKAVPDLGVAGLRQGAVLGTDAGILGPVLAKATLLTRFTSGGRPWALYVRPLLPDELAG